MMPNVVEIGQTTPEIWGFFSKMAAVRHLGFVMHVFGPPTKDVLAVFIAVQRL